MKKTREKHNRSISQATRRIKSTLQSENLRSISSSIRDVLTPESKDYSEILLERLENESLVAWLSDERSSETEHGGFGIESFGMGKEEPGDICR